MMRSDRSSSYTAVRLTMNEDDARTLVEGGTVFFEPVHAPPIHVELTPAALATFRVKEEDE